MTNPQSEQTQVVGVVGAGPAGLYAAKKLASEGVDVVLLNRDLKPGGLAEYGIYPTKHKMKEGLRRQFRNILAMPNIAYFGGVEVRKDGALTLQELESLGLSSILFAIGAQGTRQLGLPGEDKYEGVFHAKDLVYHFNQLPPFAEQEFAIGQRVGIVGMGNVMVDIAHWLIREKKVEEVTVIARRGPAQRAYTDKEMRNIIQALDQGDLQKEFARIADALELDETNLTKLQEEILAPLAKAQELDSPTQLRFRFLCSTKQVLGDDGGRMTGVEVEHNHLVEKNGRLRPQGTGQTSMLALDTLVFAIGDQVDAGVGLPFEWGKFCVPSEPHPRDAEQARYEVCDPEQGIRAGWFLGGWARSASDGLVGKARADGETAAKEILHYLQEAQPTPTRNRQQIQEYLRQHLRNRNIAFVEQTQVEELEAIEKARAQKQGTDFFKFDSNQQMLDALKQASSS